jgi:hypothetical protein
LIETHQGSQAGSLGLSNGDLRVKEWLIDWSPIIFCVGAYLVLAVKAWEVAEEARDLKEIQRHQEKEQDDA